MPLVSLQEALVDITYLKRRIVDRKLLSFKGSLQLLHYPDYPLVWEKMSDLNFH
jgi:hypothetical protein